MEHLSANIKFTLNKEYFEHNLEKDFACFALWKAAIPFQNRIKAYLEDHFELILNTEVEWSNQNFHENSMRLYEEPIIQSNDRSTRKSVHASKIGDNRFMLYVVRDKNPKYTYAQSISNKIELSNLNIVRAKQIFREWIFEASGVQYAVHSTNNINEFFYQIPLILGIDIFREIISGKKPAITYLKKDLEGANGWNSWSELFKMLNITTNYTVLRNFEGMPATNSDDDLDILTDNYQKAASTLGIIQDKKKPYKGFMQVQSRMVPVDIRFIGDNYYDTSWQKDILGTKILKNGVYIPRNDHYFFSLLFHCKAQKLKVKAKYITELNRLAKEMEFSWYNESILYDDKATAGTINGFFKANTYHYEDPVDKHVEINKAITSRLIDKKALSDPDKLLIKRVKKALRAVLPKSVISYIKGLRQAVSKRERLADVKSYEGEVLTGSGLGN